MLKIDKCNSWYYIIVELLLKDNVVWHKHLEPEWRNPFNDSNIRSMYNKRGTGDTNLSQKFI